jgi:hypothetical protein
MATRKASDSNLTGKKYNDASAGATKINDIPNQVTINSVSTVSGQPQIVVTPNATGGVATDYVASSLANGAQAVSSNTSISFSNNPLNALTTHTFVVQGRTSVGAYGPASTASDSYTLPGYEFHQTFNTSGTYTVPSGKQFVAIVGAGAGANGAGASYNAGSGGSSGPVFILEDVAVSGGQTYTVTIASGGGSNTSFGNILTAAGGAGAGTVSKNTGTLTFNESAKGGGGGGATGNNNAGGGGAGTSTGLATTNTAGISSYQAGGGGGGGGGGNFSSFSSSGTYYNAYPPGGGAGGSYSGAAGAGGGGGGQGQGWSAFATNTAGVAGRGGGGGGGGAYGHGPSNGGPGQLLIYTK